MGGTPRKCQTWSYEIKSARRTPPALGASGHVPAAGSRAVKLYFSPSEDLHIFFLITLWLILSFFSPPLCYSLCYRVELKTQNLFTGIIAFKYWERWVHAFHPTDWCVYCLECLLSLSSTRPENCLYLSKAQPNQHDPRGIQLNEKSNYDIEDMKTFLLKFSL